MAYAKVNIKGNYKEQGDLVFRPLLRAYQKLGIIDMQKDESIPLIGIAYNDEFYEFTTWKKMDNVDFQIISREEFISLLKMIKIENISLLRMMINQIVFYEGTGMEQEISSMEDLALDRRIDFEGYNNNLTNINPYQEPLNGYNDFGYKCKMKKKMDECSYGRKI